jgi:HemY protein
MIKAFIYLVLAAVAAVGMAWFANNPGKISVEWLGHRSDLSLFTAAVFFILAIAALLFLARILRKLLMGPGRIRRKWRQKRVARGQTALRKGIFAVGAGDKTSAIRCAADARRILSDEPLTQLLLAQSAQLNGDRRTAQRIFEAMSEDPEMQLLGLRGLFLEASHDKQMEAAQQFASRAMMLNPSLSWPVNALFDMQCQAQNWQGALETLTVARNHHHVDRRTAERRRAVLLTAQAMDFESSQPEKAIELALEAHKLAPGFVPAAHIAGRLLANGDNAYKAGRVLARTWQYTPHPDLAATYAYLRPGDSPRDRLARIRSLIVMAPDDVEARIALARAAADAREWEEARDALQLLLTKNPTARVCALMARIEGGEKRDSGRVREWLARAVRAPRDPMWIADGVSSNEWLPISPVTGKLDAFTWQVPDDRSESLSGFDDGLIDEISALSHELEAGGAEDIPSTAEEETVTSSHPVTITVTAVETSTAEETVEEKTDDDAKKKADVVSMAEKAEKQTGFSKATKTSKDSTTTETKIFVPGRPPDDPGPGVDFSDIDETSTAIGRFRTASKAK